MKLRACLFVSTLLYFFAGSAIAQVQVNTDSLFYQAQEQARTGHYRESRQLLKQVLQAAPTYTDAALLMGRTYAWEERFDSARFVLLPLLDREPGNTEVMLALADVELWAGNPEKSLEYAAKGLELNPDATPLLLVQARARQQMLDYTEALASLNRLLELEPDNVEARKLLSQVRGADWNNLIRADLQVTAFNESFSSWQLASLEYTRVTPSGKFLGRVSYADRFDQRSTQFELDGYPKLNKDVYLYLNAGFSDNKLFPKYRLGAEVYHLLPYKFEASVGARLLSFPDEKVLLYTGHLGKYFKKQWVALRPFLQLADGDLKATGSLLIRQYFRHSEDHITLVLAQGSTPVTPVGLEEIGRLNASRIGLESQFRAGTNFLFGGLFSYEYEEYQPGSHRNRFTFGLSLQRKF